MERLLHYYVANGVTDDEQKVFILLTLCGTATYKLLHSLAPSNKLEGVSSATLIGLLIIKPNIINDLQDINTKGGNQMKRLLAMS